MLNGRTVSWNDLEDKPFGEEADGTIKTLDEKYLPDSIKGGGSATALSKKQINALDALFKAASYIKDVSAEYAVFCEAFGLTNPDEPSEDVVVLSVKQGTVSFENGKMTLTGTANSRATLVPIGQYLKKGTTYNFSLGDAASTYVYGVQIFVADSPALEFPHVYESVIYDGVTERLVDSGWITTNYTYTVDKDNCILAVNFRKKDYTNMSDSDYAALLGSFTMEEVTPEENTPEVAWLMHKYITKRSDGIVLLDKSVNPLRMTVYSATTHSKRYAAPTDDNPLAVSDYSPLKIPVGAVSAIVDVPGEMRYGVFICRVETGSSNRVSAVVDSGWITDGSAIDVSAYGDGNYYLGSNIAYISNAEIPADFDTSVLDIYFVDADGNRM